MFRQSITKQLDTGPRKQYQCCPNKCRVILIDFHLLLIGVYKTIITMVGEVVASSPSLHISAVRAKLDSRYMQRQLLFPFNQQFESKSNGEDSGYRCVGLMPIPVSDCGNNFRNRYYRKR